MTARTVLITGGSRGIGAATARLAAERGWQVAVSYRERSADADEASYTTGALLDIGGGR